jgi:riboflavin biosynthesis protein RibD
MYRALELAKKGTGAVNPNPLVGAVLVKDNRIIGEGYHQKYGQLHAERNAIADCCRRGENPAGAELYVTLEPCCHYGKTPPCTEAIIENKIVKVYVGSNDPNPLVDGGGIAVLRAHGIEVETGILKQECDALNEIFFHYIRTKRPFVLMKYAMTMDGKIATVTGDFSLLKHCVRRNRNNRRCRIFLNLLYCSDFFDNPCKHLLYTPSRIFFGTLSIKMSSPILRISLISNPYASHASLTPLPPTGDFASCPPKIFGAI